ncbi:MAG: ribonuclease III [Nitrospirae bacterium]|jgi:ribonuclease-3|nr:ribonuclease III [Nitrospirota bacterium]
MKPHRDLSELEERLRYRFRKIDLLEEATTHKSFMNEGRRLGVTQNNERLEFLGDTVLGLIVAEYLMVTYPKYPEGVLSKFKGRVVSEPTLATVSRVLGIGGFLLIGKGEELTQGREKSSLLADAMEAIIAAIYLDSGLDAARTFIIGHFRTVIEQTVHEDSIQDYKTDLQEYCQRELETLPVYQVMDQRGPDHQKEFDVAVLIRGKVYGEGSGRSKKEAEQKAAKDALSRLARTSRDVFQPGKKTPL